MTSPEQLVEVYIQAPLKRAFALELLYGLEAQVAAAKLRPESKDEAYWIATNWPQDGEVVSFLEAAGPLASAVGESDAGQAELPDDTAYALYIWRCAQRAVDDADKHRFLKLYAEITGKMKKPEDAAPDPAAQAPTVVNVIAYPNLQDPFEYARQQQDKLQKDLAEIVVEDADADDN